VSMAAKLDPITGLRICPAADPRLCLEADGGSPVGI
jgi:hypothetical protein